MDVIECGFEVGVDDFVPLFLGHTEQQRVHSDTRVVHKHIYAAEFLLDFGDRLFGRFEVGCVGDIHPDLCSEG